MRRWVLLLLCTGLVTGCADSPIECETDEDCREGFTCDQDLFRGDCVQYKQVVRCGAELCELPDEVCGASGCAPAGSGGDGRDAAVTGGGGPGTGGAGGGGPGPSADAAVGPEPVDAAVEPDTDPSEPIAISIESPADGDTFVDTPPFLSGQVSGLGGGTLTWQLSGPAGTNMAERPLEQADGMFRLEMRVPPGRFTVTVRARDGARSAEAERAFRYDTFVRRDGNRLALDGERYRFIGLSVPDLHTAAFRHLAVGGEDPVEEVMREAQALGVRVLRVRAFDDRPDAPSAIQSGPGEHPRAGLTALDRIVEQAAGHGIKLILTLVGHNDAYGGPTQYLRWAGYASPVPADHPLFYLNPQIREAVKSHVAFLLTRVHPQTGLSYANEPAIMGWEVMDGLDGQGVLDPENGGTEANQFLQDLTEHVRALAPNQLVGTGEFGFDVNPNPYGAAWGPLRDAGLSALLDGTRAVAFSRNVALETVDYGGFQALPDTWQFPDASNGIANLGAWWVRGHAAVAVGAGRPVVLTNAAMRHGGGLGARRVALRAWFDEVLALDLDGFIVGELYPDAIDLPAGPEAWRFDATQPFDSPSNVYADLIRTFADELTAAP